MTRKCLRGELIEWEEMQMTATTPHLNNEDMLGPLASRYVDVGSLPWKPTPCPGIDMKVLLEDKETGLLTALFRWQPGAELSLHEHVEVEQTFVIEGSLEDDEGEVTAGNYVWRPKGNRHIAKSPNGALVLSVFLKPNIFLQGPGEGQQLR
jgi:anti-sigma factor ChrR (cupin superfamily)